MQISETQSSQYATRIGELAEIAHAKGLSAGSIAEETQLAETTVRRYLRGAVKKPRKDVLERLELAIKPSGETPSSKGLFAPTVSNGQSNSEDELSQTLPADALKVEDGGMSELRVNDGSNTEHDENVEATEKVAEYAVEQRWKSGMVTMDNRGKLHKDHEPTQEIFIPVHGFVWLTRTELKVVDHKAFQRLRRVKQLGMAHLVYPGATHTRYEHVLGVLHITSRIIEAVARNSKRARAEGKDKDPSDSSHWGLELGAREQMFSRLAALLHDIGHLPFGHSVEDELGLLNKHDKEDRLRLILEAYPSIDKEDEQLSYLIDQCYREPKLYLKSVSMPISPSEIVISIILHGPVRNIRDCYREYLTSTHKSDPDYWVTEEDVVQAFSSDLALIDLRLEVCADIVGNTICSDLLDYLHRDWHHVGKSKFIDDRILHYMEIRTDPKRKGTALNPTVNPADRFVLNLGRYPRLRTDAISLILELLESRYNLAEAVLFHRAKLKLTAMLERCLSLTFPLDHKLKGGEWDKELEKALLCVSEDGFLDELCSEQPKFKDVKYLPKHQDQRQRLAQAIRDRKLFRHIHTVPMSEGPSEVLMRCQDIYTDRKYGAIRRDEALRQLENDFQLKRGQLVMYCPNKKMNSKIAEVKVLLGGELHKLDDFDNQSVQKLAAGHLSAQLERFKRLWLITFLVDPAVKAEKALTEDEFKIWRRLLADYIQVYVIGTSQGRLLEQARFEIAERLASSPVFLKSVGFESQTLEIAKKPDLAAARANESDWSRLATRNECKGIFPTDAPSFWLYVTGANQQKNESPGVT